MNEDRNPSFSEMPEEPFLLEDFAEEEQPYMDGEEPEDDKPSGFYGWLCGLIPKWGDKPLDLIRKVVFFAALCVLIGSISYLLNEMVIIPYNYDAEIDFVKSLYTPGVAPELTDAEKQFPYPAGITEDFKKLYFLNQDVRGWLTYESTDDSKFINISYPVLYSGDNDYYLNHDFQKANNRNGSLFLDFRNAITARSRQQSLIIYGHNLSNDQMFTRLNYLVRKKNNVYYARHAMKMTFSTLYDTAEYLVFSVMVCNTREEDGPVFQYLRTTFVSEQDFAEYIAEVRLRSLYNYDGVTVRSGDELLILSTCNSESYAGVEDGRTVVVARKVREGENSDVNPYTVTINEEAVMPYVWYIKNGIEAPAYYTDGHFVLPVITTAPTTSTEPTEDPSTTEPTEPTDQPTDKPTDKPTDQPTDKPT
ncbi:MAG: sortase, partial [Clostridia bacterium]|nr:sortase [Clostridia bacterium]